MNTKQMPVVGPVSQLPANNPQQTAFIGMLERAMRDTSVPMDRMQFVMDTLKQAQADEAEANFNSAMSVAQAQIKRVVADKDNNQTRSKYASYAGMDRAIRPIYTAAGFAISFNEDVGVLGPEMVRVLAYVTHTAPGAKRSHTRTYSIDIPADGKGAKGGDVMTKTHAHMSAVTYGKRGLIGMIFNLAVGSDDDGNAAGATGPAASEHAEITPAQLTELRDLIDQKGVDEARVCKRYNVQALREMTAKTFAQAKAKLESMENVA